MIKLKIYVRRGKVGRSTAAKVCGFLLEEDLAAVLGLATCCPEVDADQVAISACRLDGLISFNSFISCCGRFGLR